MNTAASLLDRVVNGQRNGSASVASRDAVLEPSSALARRALRQAKREGLVLAVRARWIGLTIIAIMLPFMNPNWHVLYFHAYLVLFALIGWAQLKLGRVGRSRWELALMFCDLALMTIVILVPNPFSSANWPTAMEFRFGTFIYFFILLAAGTLAYTWRTVVAMGIWTTAFWMIGTFAVTLWPNAQPELTEAAKNAFGAGTPLAFILDPNRIDASLRLQEIVVFLIAAATLALSVKRSSELLLRHAAIQHQRANLARYFSPNVVDELSVGSASLKRGHQQQVTVLFADIVGFTSYAEGKEPDRIIAMLSEFHGRMERQVFAHGGTLDKYLGDGLMATFGTPFPGDEDSSNAMRCAYGMLSAIDEWNRARAAAGREPIQVSIGLHCGSAVVGDIGANRLEFTVIGQPVNVASRLERLTRELDCAIAASNDFVEAVKAEKSTKPVDIDRLEPRGAVPIRGLDRPMDVWTCS